MDRALASLLAVLLLAQTASAQVQVQAQTPLLGATLPGAAAGVSAIGVLPVSMSPAVIALPSLDLKGSVLAPARVPLQINPLQSVMPAPALPVKPQAAVPAPAARPTALGSLQDLSARIDDSRRGGGGDQAGQPSDIAFDGSMGRRPSTFEEIPSLDARYTTPESRGRTVTVLGSSRDADPIRGPMSVASRVAAELVRRGYNILTGCGNAGIMGAAYDAAAAASREAPEAGENLAIVVTPAWGDENLADARAIGIADSEAARIEKFHQASDTFLVFPGGASTLQEAATLIAKNVLGGRPKRILLVGRDFFRGLQEQYDRLYAEGRLNTDPRELFEVVDSADEVIAAASAPAREPKPARTTKAASEKHTRQAAGAYLVYPGGPAALQEAATLIARNKYRGKNPPMRIFLIGREFFGSLARQYERLYKDGLLGSRPEELFSVVDADPGSGPEASPSRGNYEKLFLSFVGHGAEKPKTGPPLLSPSDTRSWGLENVPDSRYSEVLEQASEHLRGRTKRPSSATPSLLGLFGRIWRFDKALYYHMVRVGLMAARIALTLGHSSAYAQDLSLAARLHDVGKMDRRVHDVISRPSRLTPQERALIETHPEKGAESLSAEDLGPERMWRMAARVARHHHEAYDGSGYPDRLRGTDIPLEARITAVADVFDALMENRPYRKGMTAEEALTVMEDEKGRFDPAVYSALLQVLRRGGYLDKSDEGSRNR